MIRKLYEFVNWPKDYSVQLEVVNTYEPLFEESLSLIEKDWNIVDVGAGIGCHTVDMAKRNPEGIVLAIEPHPKTAYVLGKNVSLYKLRNVCIIQKAVSLKHGKIKMREGSTRGGTSISPRNQTKTKR